MAKKDCAKAAVTAIVKDLTDRRSLRQAWESIDTEIRSEIREVWAGLIRYQFARYEGKCSMFRVAVYDKVRGWYWAGCDDPQGPWEFPTPGDASSGTAGAAPDLVTRMVTGPPYELPVDPPRPSVA